MVFTPRPIVAACVGAAAVWMLAGCTNGDHSSAQTSSPPTSFVSASTSAVDQPSHHPAAGRQVVGTADGVDITITSTGRTTVRPGGPPLPFSVTLVNTTTTDYAQVGLVVSLGHCSCNPSGIRMMPDGTMSMFDPGTNAWLTVPYVAEGSGTDFLARTVVPQFTLTHGQALTYRFRLRVNANQAYTVGPGDSAVHVTMTSGAGNTPVGPSPTASLPITVQP